MVRLPNMFKQEFSGVGATLEKRWKFCGFEALKSAWLAKPHNILTLRLLDFWRTDPGSVRRARASQTKTRLYTPVYRLKSVRCLSLFLADSREEVRLYMWSSIWCIYLKKLLPDFCADCVTYLSVASSLKAGRYPGISRLSVKNTECWIWDTDVWLRPSAPFKARVCVKRISALKNDLIHGQSAGADRQQLHSWRSLDNLLCFRPSMLCRRCM